MRISIITVSLNSAATIESTLESVGRQSFSPLEHILIDGGSTDGTLDIIERYRPGVTHVISQPDHGIYDAMNKGIAMATGDVIGILNADDFYVHEQVIAMVAAAFDDESIDVCYGDLEYVDSDDTDKVFRYWKSGTYQPDKFYLGWMPPHPTFFARRSLYETHGLFNLDLGSSADYELMLRFLLRYGAQAQYIPKVLVRMRTGGASNASLGNRFKANRMDRRAWRVNGLTPYPWTLFLKPLSKLGQFFIRK